MLCNRYEIRAEPSSVVSKSCSIPYVQLSSIHSNRLLRRKTKARLALSLVKDNKDSLEEDITKDGEANATV